MDPSRAFNRQIRNFIRCIYLVWLPVLIRSPEGRAQISPGDLSKAHADLSGPSHCTDCHDRGVRPPQFKCLNCHRDIRERLALKKGLHPALVGADKTGRTCAKCHTDHNGTGFNLIHWDTPEHQFDHKRAGYRLEGKHAQVACRKCHQPANIPVAAREDISTKDLTRTYLGLTENCSGCHGDVHQGQLSSKCERCHDPGDWKNPARFDHKQARFQLDKTHLKVACDKCHMATGGAQSTIKYKGIPFEDCSPCHRDPHANSFKTACRSCHNSDAGWKSANASAIFKHSQTRFPLQGKHAGVACDACHPRGNFAQPLVFARCQDCHKKDPHGGQFTSRAKGGDCDECHTVQDFKQTTFGVAQHSETRFPLKEHHLEIKCSECHIPNAAVVLYRIKDFSCIACHRDIHESQFAGPPYRNRCESCHSQSVFKPSTYTTGQHADTRFPLSGGHVKVSCAECHKSTSKPVKFRFEDRTCTVCHQDPHHDQFADRMAAALPGGGIAGCQSCHTTNTWRDLDKFDHATTGFPLEQAHLKDSCDKCHKAVGTAAAAKDTDYRSAPRLCTGCHEDPHEGQFASRMAVLMPDGNPKGCRSCHTILSWNEMAGFDHSATEFPLEGAHREVACAKCHPSRGTGVRGIDYVATPRQCSGCHEDIHDGQFASNAKDVDCTQCHQVLKWVPSTFDHDRQSTYKLEGAHREVRCGLCHAKTREVAGKKIVIYKTTPRECSGCHGPGT